MSSIAMLGRTNIVAYVQAEPEGKPTKELVLHDHYRNESIAKVMH